MNKDRKLRLLLAPFIVIVFLFVPVVLLEIIPESMNAYIQQMPRVIWALCAIMIGASMIIGGIIYIYVPIGVYIAMVVGYTVVCWAWILRQKKENAIYAIIWFFLCVLSVLMYWRGGAIAYELLGQ